MSEDRGRIRFILLTAAVAAIYFVAGKLGLRFAVVHASATAVWPPTGIALAAALLFGPRVAPGVFLGAFLTNATIAVPLGVAVGIASGNTMEALMGAFLANAVRVRSEFLPEASALAEAEEIKSRRRLRVRCRDAGSVALRRAFLVSAMPR